jgi:hypothetical protein
MCWPSWVCPVESAVDSGLDAGYHVLNGASQRILCNAGGGHGVLGPYLNCSPSAEQAQLKTIRGSYESDIGKAKANYSRDAQANDAALKDGTISEEQWSINQRAIFNEFRQAEQYFKRVYDLDQDKIELDNGGDPIDGE